MFSMMKMANSKLFHNKKAAFSCVQMSNTWYMAITPLEQDMCGKLPSFFLLPPQSFCHSFTLGVLIRESSLGLSSFSVLKVAQSWVEPGTRLVFCVKCK